VATVVTANFALVGLGIGSAYCALGLR
jgi:hypothetical protein